MASNQDRPVPRSGPIDPGERQEILHELLTVERARLANALRMEQLRSIVFPETTVIIKDIERLVAALSVVEGKPKGSSVADEALDALLREMAES